MIVKKDRNENGGGASGGRARNGGRKGRVILVVSSLFRGLLGNGTPDALRESGFTTSVLTQNYDPVRESRHRWCTA